MAVKVAINGFGRIGRLVLRAMIESNRRDVECVAINDLGSVEANAHLFRYDSVHGRFPGEVAVDGNKIIITANGRIYAPIIVSAERDPTKVPFQGVDVALECTGIFTSKEKASALITAGARKVVIGCDHCLGRQSQDVDERHDGDFQRVLHHEVPGACRQGAA